MGKTDGSNFVSDALVRVPNDRDRRWYLGGPMTGYPEFNFPAFTKAADQLRNNFGLTVIAAHEVDHGEHTGAGTQPYVDYLRGDLVELLKCDGLILLQGWPESKGAVMELGIAIDLGYPIYHFDLGRLIPLSREEKFNV